MAFLLRRISKSLIPIPINQKTRLINTDSAPKDVAKAIRDSFRSSWNWDTLTTKFESVKLDGGLVESVLLELKEPIDAKRALGFFHWAAHRKCFEHGVWSYSITIHILARARLLMDARALLESVLKKTAENGSKFSVVDSLLSSYEAYAKLRMFETGFDVCCYLGEHGLPLSLITYNTLLHVVQKSDQTALEGKLKKYVDMLDRIHGKRCSPSVIVNTSLVFSILEEGRVEEGLMLLRRMLQKNMVLDTIAYSLIVYAKVKLGDVCSAWEVYEEMLKRGFRANSFVYTLFMGARCEGGRIEEAQSMMNEMENMDLKPFDESYNLLIEGCAKAGRVDASLSYLKKMVETGFIPCRSAFNEMVGSYVKQGMQSKQMQC
ncbi:pentatricopeptide repeat-containing protein [Prunus yedoensis var. nudiflora]|uniref:Pentatricopeptide repeat-containing protein n=1 Tax=Prunus yedoensis var. nudiflora TaxID=2094558 RepID=A0A314YPN7_PRUYE|nr:pentatricopeptide repeat-containing protein [Prunus yedoensis var. nudiflora]